MLIFGHPGITLGVAALLSGALGSRHFSQDKGGQAAGSCQRSPAAPASDCSPGGKASWLTYLGGYLDIRLLLVGSLLPDIIDKPVGHFFFKEIFSHGRIFSHTLLFLVLVALVGLYLYLRHNKGWCLVLSFGTFSHLILDQMWRAPQTLFWPLYGFAFDRIELTDWIPKEPLNKPSKTYN